jgi:hypothetical protein
MITRNSAIIPLATLAFLAGQASAVATPADSQVTDAITQANVKVVADSPAMAMGTIYQSTAQSTGLMANNAPRQVTHAQAITTQGVQKIYSVDTAAGATPTTRMTALRQDSQSKVLRKIDAMAQRLAECGDACLLNLHFHTSAGPTRDASKDSCTAGEFTVNGADLPPNGAVDAAQLLATCIVARMETKSGVDVEGVAWVIADPSGDTTTPVTRVDMYVQRLP